MKKSVSLKLYNESGKCRKFAFLLKRFTAVLIVT